MHPTKEEARAYTYLALTLSKLDDFDNCCAAYDKAIEMNKDDPLVYVNYATTLYLEGEMERSREIIKNFREVMERLSEETIEEVLEEHPEIR